MCTVTILPSEGGFILTSNRDEKLLRQKAINPQLYSIHNQNLYFPKDPKASGTWICTSEKFTLCLLNGAFEGHTPNPPYKKSRGLVLLDFFQFNDPQLFSKAYDFIGIEPFTLVIVNHVSGELHELRWDEKTTHLKSLDKHEKHIWSSSTLYNKETRGWREKLFKDWCEKNKDYNQNDIVNFHRFGGKGDSANDFVMNRNNETITLSITSIIYSSQKHSIQYNDIVNEETFNLIIRN